MTPQKIKEDSEKQEVISNGMDAIKESIEQNKENKDVLGVAYKLFNKGIDLELNQYSNIDNNGKDKIKVVLWKNLVENLSLTGSLKAGLSKFTSMFSNIGSIFSEDEGLSETSQKTGSGFVKVEGKLKGTPLGDLMGFLKEKIGEEKFKVISEIDKLNPANKNKLLNNPEGLENLFTKGLEKGETLDSKIKNLPKSEKDFSQYVSETIKETNKRGKTLGRFKKIGDKILGLADKFGFKDSLVSMLDMLYKIPGIGPILKMLFAPKIKANFDQYGLNGPEGKSIYILKKFLSDDKNKDILGFNPSDKIPSEDDEKKLVPNPDKLTKEDLKTFYSKFDKYFENQVRKSGETDEKKIKFKIGKLKKIITSSNFWPGILTGKNSEGKELNSKNTILKLINQKIGTKDEISNLDKGEFCDKLNSLDLDNLQTTEVQKKQAEEASKKEKQEAEKLKLEKEKKYRENNKKLETYLKTNDNILGFKLDIVEEKEDKKEKTGTKTETKEKKEKETKLTENQIPEKTLFNFYDKIETYNKALKPEESKNKITIDDNFWIGVLTGKDSNQTKLPEENILSKIYNKFKDKLTTKKDFESALNEININTLSLEKTVKDLDKTIKIDTKKEAEKAAVVATTAQAVDSKVKQPIQKPETEAEILAREKEQEAKKEKLEKEIKEITNIKIPNTDLEISKTKLSLENLKTNKEKTQKSINEKEDKIKEINAKIKENKNTQKKDNFFLNSMANFVGYKTDEQEENEILEQNKKELETEIKNLYKEINKISTSILEEETQLKKYERKLKNLDEELKEKKEELKNIPEKKKAK